MALGGLTKVNAKRRGGSTERNSCESVIGAAPAATPELFAASAKVAKPAGNGIDTPDTSVATATPKPARPASRTGGSRPKVDSKSVISGLNSSSSASLLLGPMMQGGPKRRSAKT